MVAYLAGHEAEHAAAVIGFDEATYIERDGAQAFLFANEHDKVIACRGTEPNEWNDIKADANALTDIAETVGRVHRGFKREVDDVWPNIEAELVEPDERALWVTGHSLGGAMAQIVAGRCRLADIPAWPAEVYTYGSPRVGNPRYIAYNDVQHVRWVNNNDVVTRVPPTWLRYRHRGDMMYLDANGDVHARISKRKRVRDQWNGFKRGLKQRRIDHFSDHAIAAYVAHLTRAVESQK